MFKLTEQDLKVAKPLANIFVASFLVAGILFGTNNLELLALFQGIFPILALIILYYSLKLVTDQERSLMFPFLLMAGAQSANDSYGAFESIRQGTEFDIYLVHTFLLVCIILLLSGVINQSSLHGADMQHSLEEHLRS